MASVKEKFAKKKEQKQLKFPSFEEIDGYANSAKDYYTRGRLELAIEQYTKYIESISSIRSLDKNILNSRLAEIYNNRGICYQAQKNYERAIEDYKQSIRLKDYFSKKLKLDEIYNSRALCYMELDEYQLALADFNEALQFNPNSYTVLNNRGSYYSKQGEYQLALDDYNTAIQIEPNNYAAYVSRGNCYVEQKNYELALTSFNKAIELNSGVAIAYGNRAFCYIKLGENERALNDYKTSILNDNLEINIQQKELSKEDYALLQKENEVLRENLEINIQQKELSKEDYELLQKENEVLRENLEINIQQKELSKEDYELLLKENEVLREVLGEKNQELELEIKQKESLQNRMQKLVSNFTHNLGNFFPDIIYQVAERWKNNPECRKDVLLLHEAYHSEIIIKLQGELLRQRYANTNPEKFRQFIRNCRRLPNNADNTKSIEDILDYAASRATARFLNQHYAGLNTIRDKILAKKGVDINALKQKFEDDILLNKSSRPIAWINENLRPIQITEISPLWKKVYILAVSHAEALLFGYFSEILFNAFKYADHDKDEFLTLVFDESVINDKTYLACSWKNPVKDKTPLLGTSEGLDGIQEDLKQLNDTENPEQSLLVQQQNNQFQVTLFFNKDLLIDDLPILTRKRKMIEANHA